MTETNTGLSEALLALIESCGGYKKYVSITKESEHYHKGPGYFSVSWDVGGRFRSVDGCDIETAIANAVAHLREHP